MVGAETRRVVAAVQDVERARQVEAEEQRGRESVHRVTAVIDGDAPVAPAVAATLPLPTARQRVNRPPREQAFTEPQIVRSRSTEMLRPVRIGAMHALGATRDTGRSLSWFRATTSHLLLPMELPPGLRQLHDTSLTRGQRRAITAYATLYMVVIAVVSAMLITRF